MHATISRFWAKAQRYETLCRGFQALQRATGQSDKWFEDEIAALMKRKNLGADFACSVKTIERLAARKPNDGKIALKGAKKRTGLLLACEDIIEDLYSGSSDEHISTAVKELEVLIAEFHQEVGSLGVAAARDAPVSTDTDVGSVLSYIAQQLFIRPADLYNVARCLFPDWKDNLKSAPELHFLCYRYDTRPGYVAKSFVRVFAPTAEAPLCRFKNHYEDDRGHRREASGLVLPTKTTLYFLGQIDEGSALKVMAFRHRDRPQMSYEGLLLSYTDQLIASRIVMVRTEKKDDKEAGIGVFKAEQIQNEISRFKADLKNFINFKMDKPIYRSGKVISQADMVSLVNNSLKDKDDEPLLKFEDGTPFRPASTEQYTFNSALQLRHPNEPNEE